MLTVVLARFVARSFIPFLVLGLCGAVAWRRLPRGRLQTALQIVASLLFFVPIPLVLFLANYSVDLLLYQRMILALIGYLVTALVIFKLKVRAEARFVPGEGIKLRPSANPDSAASMLDRIRVRTLANRHKSPVKLIMVLIFSISLSGLTSWYLVGDYLLPHRTIEGFTGNATYIRGSRSPGHYELSIDGIRYKITRDLLSSLHRHERVRAEIGIASNTVLRINPL